MSDTPFDSIESAHEYVAMLRSQVDDVSSGITRDIEVAAEEHAERRVEALRLVDYKLKQLQEHLTASSRILNDFRALRRLLLRGSR